jgi:hypothetical protein
MIMPMQNKSEIGNSDGMYQQFAGNSREKSLAEILNLKF